MVKRFFSVIGREIRGLHEAAYLLAAFALLSQIIALFRDKLLAYSFGAGHSLDIYYAAFRIPDFLFAVVGSLVSASILLPYFIDRFGKGADEGRHFASEIFTAFFALIIVVSAIVFVLAPYIIPRVIPGFADDPSLPTLILSARIMLLSPIFLGLSNLLSSLTQMRHRFLVYALSPLVYNLGIIIGTLFVYPYVGVAGLAVGVGLGAFMHMAVQLPFLLHEKLVPRFAWIKDWEYMRKIIITAVPRTITLSANELAEFVLISVASFMAGGSISVFNFAYNLQSVPLALIGGSYSVAVFPTLSKLFFEKNAKAFLEKMITAARHIVFWSLPGTALFIVLRAQIVRTILGAGKFNWADTRLTAAALALFIVSTVGQSLIVLFVRAFYAEGKTARPLSVNVLSAASIIASGFGFIWLFDHASTFRFFLENLLKVDGQAGTSVLTLALAYSVGIFISTVLHWAMFERAYAGFTRSLSRTLFQSFAAAVISGYAAHLALSVFAAVFPLTKVWGVFMQGLVSGLIGLIVAVLVFIILRNRELPEIYRALHHKIWKATVPPAEVEHM